MWEGGSADYINVVDAKTALIVFVAGYFIDRTTLNTRYHAHIPRNEKG